LSERFESRVLPLFKRQSQEVGELLPELYLHGLSSGDFDLALRGLLGEAAPLSASSIDRLKAVWQAEYEEWRQRPLADLEVVYLWVDGIYVKAGLEKDKAAILVVLAEWVSGIDRELGSDLARAQVAGGGGPATGGRRWGSRGLGGACHGGARGGAAPMAGR